MKESGDRDIPEPGYPDPNPWNLRRNREAVRCLHCTSILEDEAEKRQQPPLKNKKKCMKKVTGSK